MKPFGSKLFGEMLHRFIKAIAGDEMTEGAVYKKIATQLNISPNTIKKWRGGNLENPLPDEKLNRFIEVSRKLSEKIDDLMEEELRDANAAIAGTTHFSTTWKKKTKENENYFETMGSKGVSAITNSLFETEFDSHPNRGFNKAIQNYIANEYFSGPLKIRVAREIDIYSSYHLKKGLLLIGNPGTGKLPLLLSSLFKKDNSLLKLFVTPEIGEKCKDLRKLIEYWCETLKLPVDRYLSISADEIHLYFDNIDRLSTEDLDRWSIQIAQVAAWRATSRRDVPKLHEYSVIPIIPGFLNQVDGTVLGNKPELRDSIGWLPRSHHSIMGLGYLSNWENLATFVDIWDSEFAPSMWDVARTIWDQRIKDGQIGSTAVVEFAKTLNFAIEHFSSYIDDQFPTIKLTPQDFPHDFDYKQWEDAGLLARDQSNSVVFVNTLINDYFLFEYRMSSIIQKNTQSSRDAAWMTNYLLGKGQLSEVAIFLKGFIREICGPSPEKTEVASLNKLVYVADVVPVMAMIEPRLQSAFRKMNDICDRCQSNALSPFAHEIGFRLSVVSG